MLWACKEHLEDTHCGKLHLQVQYQAVRCFEGAFDAPKTMERKLPMLERGTKQSICSIS